MKTASKIRHAAFGVLLSVCLMPIGQVFAQGMGGMSSISIDSKSDSKGSDGALKKEPEAVKTVVKKLSASTEDMTVDDLNAAREAVAKLDILIDIEKRLSDLAEIRAEREEKSGEGLAKALPPAALMPPPMPVASSMGGFGSGFPAAPAPIVSAPPPPPVIESVSVDVDRVVGAAGRYVALVRVAGDSQKKIRVGDKIVDGSIVESISPGGVTLVKNKKSRTVRVNNPAPIFGSRK